MNCFFYLEKNKTFHFQDISIFMFFLNPGIPKTHVISDIISLLKITFYLF